MLAYYFVDFVDGAEVLVAPGCFIARHYSESGEVLTDFNPSRLENNIYSTLLNWKNIDRGLALGVVQEHELYDEDVIELNKHVIGGRKEEANKKSLEMVVGLLEEINAIISFSCLDDFEDEEEAGDRKR